MNKKTILITGSTGFLGSHLLKALLAQKYQFIALKRSSSNIFRIKDLIPEIKMVDLDNINIEQLFKDNKIDIILHCATDYGRKTTDPFNVLDANLILPLKLLEYGKRYGISCFINTDTFLDKRLNYYTLSKNQFNDWLKTYSKDIKCINVVLEHFYGPFDDKTKFVSFVIDRMIGNASSIDLTKGQQKRDFIFIDDVVDAFKKIIDKHLDMDNGYYNYEIGTGKSIKIRSLVEEIKEIANNKTTRLNFGALPYRQNETMDSKVNIRPIKALGWTPKYSLHEGLKKTIEEERKVRS